MERQKLFTKQSIWALLIPLMIEQVLNSLMGTADTMMVTATGSAAISAVALVDSINVLLIYLFSAMATGGAAICAQYLGRRQLKEANEIGRQLILTVTLLSVVIMALCIVLRRPLLKLIFGQIEADVMQNAIVYFLITAASYPFIALYNAGAALFRVDGNSRLPMAISMISNVVNIAGNAVLIFGLHMGVAGAALATLFSRMFCAIAVLAMLRLPRQNIVVRDYAAIRPRPRQILNILEVGLPTGVENSMFQFGKLAIQSTVSTLGTVAIAAQAIAATMELLISNIAMGIGLGMITVVGQCIGAGRPDEARENIKRMTGYAEIVTIVSSIALALMIRPVTRIAGMEPEAAKLAVSMVMIICIVKPFFWTASFIPAYGMRAAGDVRFSMILASCTMWLCRVAITIVLIRVFHFGPIAVWIGMFTDWVVRGVSFGLRFHSNRWLEKKVIRE